MAQKAKKPAVKKTTSTTKVTRITASDEPKKPVVKTVAKKSATTNKKETPAATVGATATRSTKNPISAIAGYFRGSWYELRQVRWPDRKATWSLTLAMLIFTGFFAGLILLLDALFKYLFQLILG